VAAVLLIGGGLEALQTATIVTGLPFAIILLIMCYSLYKGLREDLQKLEKKKSEKQ
ncbi:MAG TPA: choline transporter, partial [Leeuwenhoekiella sp.]|nr:choline transporter [Leeuwenhoekiella sp.]